MISSPNAIVIMGISGCGKSTLGHALAAATGYRFIEGDDLHPAANVARMSAGIPLTDEDRWPWLARVADMLSPAEGDRGRIVSCSALKYAYRDFLRARLGDGLLFVFPNLSIDIVRDRLHKRPNHYMPVSLLESQVATLEMPKPSEHVLTINGTPSTHQSVDLIMGFLTAPQKIRP